MMRFRFGLKQAVERLRILYKKYEIPAHMQSFMNYYIGRCNRFPLLHGQIEIINNMNDVELIAFIKEKYQTFQKNKLC